MTAADILAWHDFFAAVAGAGATLAGLLFVGLTISLDHMLQASGYLSRAFTALFLQFEILLLGLFALAPGQPAWALGIEWIAAGLGVLAGIRLFAHNFPEDENSAILGSTGLRALRHADGHRNAVPRHRGRTAHRRLARRDLSRHSGDRSVHLSLDR